MCKGSLPQVHTIYVCTDYFAIEAGLLQGAGLIFIINLDVLASELGSKPHTCQCYLQMISSVVRNPEKNVTRTVTGESSI